MNAEEICNAVETGTLTVDAAIAKLEQLGHERPLAEEMIFISLGGDDVIEVDDEGVQRYYGSGKTVAEVREKMGRGDGE